MIKLRKNNLGFSAVEFLIILSVLGLIAGIGWYVYSHRSGKSSGNTTTSDSSTTAQNKNYLSPDKMVSRLAQQLSTQFSYIAAPKVQNASLTTNLFGDNTWWVNVQSPNSALTVDFTGPTTGLWQDLPSSQQATLTKQSQDVVNKISLTLKTNGYQLKSPPLQMPSGVGFKSNSDDASGYYKGSVGNCTLLRWETLPVHIELHCADAALVKTAVDSANPFIQPFSKANPTRQLSTVEVISTVLKQTNSNQYAMLNIGAPDSMNTHSTDGPNFFVSSGNTWHYLSDQTLCNDTSKVNGLLKTLGINDSSNAPQITIDTFCGSLGP